MELEGREKKRQKAQKEEGKATEDKGNGVAFPGAITWPIVTGNPGGD